jgi:hypothetical protein
MRASGLALLLAAAGGCQWVLPLHAGAPAPERDLTRADQPPPREAAAVDVAGGADTRPVDVGRDAGVADRFVVDQIVGCEITEMNGGVAIKADFDANCGTGTVPNFGVSWPSSAVVQGSYSLRIDCVACESEQWAVITRLKPPGWDLSAFDTFSFWMFTKTTQTTAPFWKTSGCNSTPTLVLVDNAGSKRTITRAGTTPDPDGSLNAWQVFKGPLKVSAGAWSGSGSVDWTAVEAVELHVGAAEQTAFAVFFDGLTFGGTTRFTQCP